MRKINTVDELFLFVWKNHWSQKRFQESGWAREVKYNYDNHVRPRFGDMKLENVKLGAIKLWHTDMLDTPYAANRALACLSKLFSVAEEYEIRPQGTNPCKYVKSFKEKKRRRFATPEEIKTISQILEREKKKKSRQVAFIYLLLYSGSRPRAIERATRDQLQSIEHNGETYGVLVFEGKTTSDSGEDEVIVLPPIAMELISSLPDLDGTLVGCKMPHSFWTSIKKEANCSDLWARDFRRTFASIGFSMGVNVGIIGELLNHKKTQTTKIYAKLSHSARLDAVAEISGQIEKIIGPQVSHT